MGTAGAECEKRRRVAACGRGLHGAPALWIPVDSSLFPPFCATLGAACAPGARQQPPGALRRASRQQSPGARPQRARRRQLLLLRRVPACVRRARAATWAQRGRAARCCRCGRRCCAHSRAIGRSRSSARAAQPANMAGALFSARCAPRSRALAHVARCCATGAPSGAARTCGVSRRRRLGLLRAAQRSARRAALRPPLTCAAAHAAPCCAQLPRSCC